MGTMPLNWAIIGDFFGRRSYATLRGIMGIFYGVATFGSPIYAGWIFDLTGSYTITLLTFAVVLALAAIFFALLRPPTPQRLVAHV
jgi:MFS family permease